MAIGRLSVGTGTKGKAGPHGQYIAREGKYAKPSDDLEKLEFTAHGNMPRWAEHEPNYFWKMSDEHERKNGSTYREHVIALPRELTMDQRHELIKDWIAQEIGDRHAYQYAIHNPPAIDGQEQPHCHLMFSERTRDGIERDPDQYFKRYNAKNPDKGGAKKANTGLAHAERKAELVAQRERWEQTCNKHLEQAGSESRISMKSLKDQGIEREPVNLTMRQFKTPSINSTYRVWLKARAEQHRATEDSNKIDVIAELAQLTEIDQGRIDDLKDNIRFIAHTVTHYSTLTHDKITDDGFYFDSEQQQQLDKFTAELADKWQINRNDSSWRLSMMRKFNSEADNNFIKDNIDILSMSQNPQEHREHAKQAIDTVAPELKPIALAQNAEQIERVAKYRRP